MNECTASFSHCFEIFAPPAPLDKSAQVTALCQWETEMAREMTGHPPSHAEAKKMKSLTLHTRGCHMTTCNLRDRSSFRYVISDLCCAMSLYIMLRSAISCYTCSVSCHVVLCNAKLHCVASRYAILWHLRWLQHSIR